MYGAVFNSWLSLKQKARLAAGLHNK